MFSFINNVALFIGWIVLVVFGLAVVYNLGLRVEALIYAITQHICIAYAVHKECGLKGQVRWKYLPKGIYIIYRERYEGNSKNGTSIKFKDRNRRIYWQPYFRVSVRDE